MLNLIKALIDYGYAPETAFLIAAGIRQSIG